MGMVSGVLVFKGFAKVGFFMIVGSFFGSFFDGFHETVKRTCSDFDFSG